LQDRDYSKGIYVVTICTKNRECFFGDIINRKMEPEKGGGITGKNNPMLSENSLPKIIRWYKGRCSFEIRKMKNAKCFGWHSRYYDQVIKNRKELNKKREYIWDNPWKWESDELNPRN